MASRKRSARRVLSAQLRWLGSGALIFVDVVRPGLLGAALMSHLRRSEKVDENVDLGLVRVELEKLLK